MLLNDLSRDCKLLLSREGKTQDQLANELGLFKGNLSRSISNAKLNAGLIDIIEAIGYDVKINYVKRHDTINSIKEEK